MECRAKALFLGTLSQKPGVQSAVWICCCGRVADCQMHVHGRDTLALMRVGCFTPLLSQFSLEEVLNKLKKLNINTVELGTGNYPGDPHCKLSMLKNEGELKEFRKKLEDHGFTISALSCHGNPLHPDKAV